MGQLAVGLAGAAVGSAFDAPALGFTAGTFLGGLLFPPDPIRIEGPRREDLRVSSSTHGRPIPEGFGVIRMPGNMIWTSGIREVQTTTEVGGKGGLGGPSQEQVSYTYFVDASFAFAQGPAEAILRVWADGKVIYDVRDPNTTGATLTATTKPGLTIRTYLGTETQLPCPTIQAVQGAANTPAFRGTVYLTLESFELTDFGNRVPQITAEVAFKATGTNSGRLSIDQTPRASSNGVEIDWQRDRISLLNASAGAGSINQWTVSTLQEVRRQPEADVLLSGGDEFSGSDTNLVGQHTGRIYNQSFGNHGRVHIIDPDSLTEVGSFGVTDATNNNHEVDASPPGPGDKVALFDWMVEGACFASGAIPSGLTEKVFLLGFSTINDGPGLIDVTVPSAPLWIGFDNGPAVTQSKAGIAEPAGAQTCNFWVIHHGGGNNTATLRKWEVDFGAKLDLPNDQIIGVNQFTVTTFANSLWDNDAQAAEPVWGPIYDHSDGNLIFGINQTSSLSAVWKYNIALDTIQWNLKGLGTKLIGERQYTQYSRIRNGRLGIADGGGSGSYVIIDTISGAVVDSSTNILSDFSDWIGDDQVVWDDTMQVFTSEHMAPANETLEQFFIGRKIGFGESLSSVITEFSGDNVNGAGLAASDFDVTQLVNDTVRGYAVTRQMAIQKAMEPLFTAYDFDATEVDDKIKYIKRGGASVATITQADIVAAAQIVTETRTQEIELPEKLDLGYIDPDIDYQENMAQAKRPGAPVPTMYSLDSQTLDLAIVFSAAEAKEIAERLLYTAWSQRRKLAFALGDNLIKLVPTNVVTLTLDSGSSFELRIVKVDIGVNHTQSYEAVVQDKTLQVLSNPVADTSIGFGGDELPTSVMTRLCLIDAPYLRDIDATNRTAIELKYAMAGFQPGWRSGTLWDSADGVSFGAQARSTSPKTYGIVTNKLPTGATNHTDKTTALNVVMVEGALSSVTDAQFLANEQVAIIGSPTLQNWEIVSFRDATENATGDYTVSYLMRGRRGTIAPEISDSHAAGELFILAERSAINRVLLALGDLNVLRYYRGVGRSDFLENATTTALASKGRPLMPHRPHQLTAAVDGSDNIDLGWERSDRLNSELTNSTSWNASLLNEDSKEYELDIYDKASGGTIIRPVTGLTSPVYEWTKANIISDLGVNNATAQIDVGSSSTFIQASGSFVTDGFLAGMKIETASFTNAANNGIFTVQTVAALTLTIEETTLVVETGTGDEVIDAIRQAEMYYEAFQISAQVGRGFGSGIITLPL